MAIQARDDYHTSKDGCGKPDGAAAVELADIAAGQGGGFALNGAGADDFSGLSVSRAGDVDGDGLADLIVAAPFANLIVGASEASPNGEVSGQSYVVFGGDFLFG
jgi:hypothetical protein